MQIEKARLPKGTSYPVQSSTLYAALTHANVTLDTHLIMHPSPIFLDAHFWPPNARIRHERLYLRVGTVKTAEAHAARQFMTDEAIPGLIEWLESILALPDRSPKRKVEHYFRQDWDGVT